MTAKPSPSLEPRQPGQGHDPTFVDPSIAFVSTYPPAMCGLATFTMSLREGIAHNRGRSAGLDVVALMDEPRGDSSVHPQEVIGSMNSADRSSIRNTARRLSGYDAVIIQHEYGIWGPDMGAGVIPFVAQLKSPAITTLHTLLSDPTPIQRRIIEGLADVSAFTIVPTLGARDRLLSRYKVDASRVEVIPHGTDHLKRPSASGRQEKTMQHHPRLLTWGLIGPGKGLELALQAVAVLQVRYPRIRYTIAGKTHPKVLAWEGEAYRRKLEDMVSALGLEQNVEFVDSYLSDEFLHSLLHDSTIVVLPYESTEQIVSGVLVEAVSANVPVVATAFSHAVELAGQGAALAVPHRRPEAMAEAIATLTDSPVARKAMDRAQRALVKDLQWTAVALRYEKLVHEAIRDLAAVRNASTAS